MSQHDPLVRLRRMCDAAREAIDMVVGRKRADLDKDTILGAGSALPGARHR